MLRSQETLGSGPTACGGSILGKRQDYFRTTPYEDDYHGWGPDIQIIDEAELKKLEKQEDRESRYRKRRTR